MVVDGSQRWVTVESGMGGDSKSGVKGAGRVERAHCPCPAIRLCSNPAMLIAHDVVNPGRPSLMLSRRLLVCAAGCALLYHCDQLTKLRYCNNSLDLSCRISKG